jgi:hypothetical protein
MRDLTIGGAGTAPTLLLVAGLELGNLLVAASGVAGVLVWSIHPNQQRKKNVAASAGEERRT